MARSPGLKHGEPAFALWMIALIFLAAAVAIPVGRGPAATDAEVSGIVARGSGAPAAHGWSGAP